MVDLDGRPSRAQYSNPPIISFTEKPNEARASAARVDPLQPGPSSHFWFLGCILLLIGVLGACLFAYVQLSGG